MSTLAQPQQNPVKALAFSRDGRTILTGSADGTARLWDAGMGKPRDLFLHHGAGIEAVVFSPDGQTALTGGSDGTVRVWEVATGKLLEPSLLHPGPAHLRPGSVHAVVFSPDGRIILTGMGTNKNHQARLWDAATRQPIGMPFRHEGSVRAVAFSPDGRSVFTGSEDKTARLWQAPVPLEGDMKRVVLWIQVATGMEVDSVGAVRVLNVEEWRERRQRLKKLGGPPAP